MTINFNADRLAAMGFKGLTAKQFNQLNSELYNTTEEIVGMRITHGLDEEKLTEFERFFEMGDDEGAFDWLTKEVPEYREIVEKVVEELDAVLSEVAQEVRAPLRPPPPPPARQAADVSPHPAAKEPE